MGKGCPDHLPEVESSSSQTQYATLMTSHNGVLEDMISMIYFSVCILSNCARVRVRVRVRVRACVCVCVCAHVVYDRRITT